MSYDKAIAPKNNIEQVPTSHEVLAKLMKMFGPFCELGISVDDFVQIFYRANKLGYNRGTFFEIMGKKLFKMRAPKYTRFSCDVIASNKFDGDGNFVRFYMEISPFSVHFYNQLIKLLEPMCKLGFSLDDFLHVYYKINNEAYDQNKFFEILGPEMFQTRKNIFCHISYKIAAWTRKTSNAPSLASIAFDDIFLKNAARRGINICILIYIFSFQEFKYPIVGDKIKKVFVNHG